MPGPRPIITTIAAVVLGGLAAATLGAGTATAASASVSSQAPASVASGFTLPSATNLRVATFNLSLNRSAPGQLEADLATGANAQARTVAEIIQRSAPTSFCSTSSTTWQTTARSMRSATTTSR
ncbi:hypothetical protein [Glaciibacter flavus]|uniref:hypothetical protein n=1 Tax=Orlajensenia flava TaxID=2565934 RepID=UPI0026A49A79